MDRTLRIENAAPSAPATLVGRVLGQRWTLVRLLGAGGSASVYEAVHRNGRRVAIKVLHRDLARDRVARKRFLTEGYAANRVRHPQAVAIMDDGEEPDGTVFLVMELLDGRSLATTLAEGMSLPVSVVATVAAGVLDVLAAAHDSGVVHRDVKPSNVFVTRVGEIKLLDFGVARVDRLGVSAITQAGATVGTPEFMAPEQAAGREADALTDVWAVGATMFQMLTRRLVHETRTASDAVIAAATLPAPPVRSINPRVPEDIARVVDRALSFHRAQRWPNARAMRQALLNAAPGSIPPSSGESVSKHTEPEASRGARNLRQPAHFEPNPRQRSVIAERSDWRWAIAILVLTAFALLAALVWWWFGVRKAPAPPSPLVVASGAVSPPSANRAAPSVPFAASPNGGPAPTLTLRLSPPNAPPSPSASARVSDPLLDQRK